MESPFSAPVLPDWESLRDTILRKTESRRVHFIELFLDKEVSDEICRRFALLDKLDASDPYFAEKREVAVQRFLGYDFVRCSFKGMEMPLHYVSAADTAGLRREQGRDFVDEHKGPITNWEEFERYPWPDMDKACSSSLDWYEKNLPDDMCVVGSGGFAHYAEYVCWLMGYETLCVALFEQRDLVAAISERLIAMYRVFLERLLQYGRVKIIWGSDDMGFRGGTLISPGDLREFVLPGHRLMAQMSHDAGRPYLLHSCGKLDMIYEDLIEDVRIDAKHSFEDTIEDVCEIKARYGNRMALLGGIDVDFLCRADETAVRARVRQTLDACMPRGGYALGTGNSVANYIPLENYLAMLDEGRRWSA